ncbi:dihydrofolate reductase family protein [Sorangium sp. So ce321]|uniref:dihydrofolate reductase family protein n=1 Tax=Sorangium sp. So ce321 TaxID=3133300 RepID=UPI003F6185C2
MRKIVYDVAVTLDNFISHEDGSVEGFLMQGDHVTEYAERLKGYDTVVMGRKTYEWGYPFGLVPGKRAYPNMDHYIFSKTLRFDEGAEVHVVDRDELAVLRRLKEGDGADIYLCGGGAFAGSLLDHGLVDQIVLKLNPILFGHGIRLFGESTRKVELALLESKPYASGAALLRYDVKYGGAA